MMKQCNMFNTYCVAKQELIKIVLMELILKIFDDSSFYFEYMKNSLLNLFCTYFIIVVINIKTHILIDKFDNLIRYENFLLGIYEKFIL